MLRKFLYIMGLLSLVALIYTVVDYYGYTTQRSASVQAEGRKTSQELKNQVNDLLLLIQQEGNRLSVVLGEDNFTKEEVQSLIKESALSIAEIQGVTACYEPYAFDTSQELYCPYYNKGTKSYIFVGQSYDYYKVGSGTAWYTEVRDKGARWVEPYYAKAAKDWYIDYGIPFYFNSGPNKGKVRGTITMSFVASGFKKIVQNLTLGKTGYGMITSTKGTLLSHPVNEFIGKKNVRDLIQEAPEANMVRAYQAIADGATGNLSFYDEDREDETMIYYDKIPATDWGMGVVFYKNDLLDDQRELHRKYIRMFNMLSLLLLSLIAIYFNKDHLDEQEIWQLSGLASALLIANIILVGYLQHKVHKEISTGSSAPIVDVGTLQSFELKQRMRAERLKSISPTSIPTGIFLDRLEFQDSYNLNVGGTIWQKYPVDLVDSIKVGFRFPQMSPFAEAAYIEESYRKPLEIRDGEDALILIGWEFRVTLRLNLEYKDFPFDKRKLNIVITPLNKEDHLLFTPDLASYSYTNPSRRPGLSETISISGNKVTESYFNYSMETIQSDFGYGDKALFEEVPVLHYNISLKRILLNSFVTYLIPIFVVVMMMFILIYASQKTNERQGIIESMAAFFFVLVFSHIDLRKEIETADLIYMEYFYFIAYFLIITSTFNLITYSKNKSKLFDFNENQIYKAAYFPLFFFLILAVTLLKFY